MSNLLIDAVPVAGYMRHFSLAYLRGLPFVGELKCPSHFRIRATDLKVTLHRSWTLGKQLDLNAAQGLLNEVAKLNTILSTRGSKA